MKPSSFLAYDWSIFSCLKLSRHQITSYVRRYDRSFELPAPEGPPHRLMEYNYRQALVRNLRLAAGLISKGNSLLRTQSLSSKDVSNITNITYHVMKNARKT